MIYMLGLVCTHGENLIVLLPRYIQFMLGVKRTCIPLAIEIAPVYISISSMLSVQCVLIMCRFLELVIVICPGLYITLMISYVQEKK